MDDVQNPTPVEVSPVENVQVEMPVPVAENAEVPVALDEFCMRLSQVERSVELIGAFHHLETAAARMSDKPSAYRARFADVLTRPAQ